MSVLDKNTKKHKNCWSWFWGKCWWWVGDRWQQGNSLTTVLLSITTIPCNFSSKLSLNYGVACLGSYLVKSQIPCAFGNVLKSMCFWTCFVRMVCPNWMRGSPPMSKLKVETNTDVKLSFLKYESLNFFRSEFWKPDMRKESPTSVSDVPEKV